MARSGLPRPNGPVLPSRRPTSPRAARAPPSLRPQKHEQECLLHKAAVALLAAPIIVAVYVGALLRRSTLARVSIAVGLSLILGMGVLSAIRTSTTVAMPTTPIVPLTDAAFTTTVDTNRDVTHAGDDPVQHADGPVLGPRRPPGRAGDAGHARLGRDRQRPHHRAQDDLDGRHAAHHHGAGRRAGAIGSAARAAGAGRLPDPRRRRPRAVAATTAIGDRVSIATEFAVIVRGDPSIRRPWRRPSGSTR